MQNFYSKFIQFIKKKYSPKIEKRRKDRISLFIEEKQKGERKENPNAVNSFVLFLIAGISVRAIPFLLLAMSTQNKIKINTILFANHLK